MLRLHTGKILPEELGLREQLGQKVREVWVDFAKTLKNPKAHWLLPWESLDEDMKEADRCIGVTLYNMGYGQAIEDGVLATKAALFNTETE